MTLFAVASRHYRRARENALRKRNAAARCRNNLLHSRRRKMKSRKVTYLFAGLALLLLASLNSYAQTDGMAALKQRIAERIAAGVPAQPAAPIPPETESSLLQGGGFIDVLERQKNSLAGTWNLVLTFSDGTKVNSTLNVALGRGDGDGSIIHSAEGSFTLPNPTLPEQGSWHHRGGTQFIASYRGYAYTDKFEFFGTIGFRQIFNVGENQETLTGRGVFEVIDAKGEVLFSDNIQIQGTRQRPVAP
jgi:hypothetical protein